MKDRREAFKGLQMHPSSRNYAPRAGVAALAAGPAGGPAHQVAGAAQRARGVLPMTRLTGGRDGVDAITPEDFVGLDNGPGERSGLLSLAAIEEVALLGVPRRDAVLRPRARPGRRAQGPARPGPDDLDLRAPEGPVRGARHPAEQGHRVGAALAAAHRFVVLRLLLAVAARDRRWTRSRGSCRRPASSPGATRGAISMASTTLPRTSRSRASRTSSLRVTEDHIGQLNAESVNTFRIQRGVRPWGARTASSDPEWRYIPIRRLFIMLRRSLEAGFAWITFEPNNHVTWEIVRRRVTEFPRGAAHQGHARRRESRGSLLRKMRC